MSRIGKKPIEIPAGVTVSVDSGNVVKVKGPKGELTRWVDADIKVSQEGNQLNVERPTDQKRHRSMHGMYRTVLNNMVQGVANGYTRQLELIGVGYKAESKGQQLELNLGYSHSILMVLPKEIGVATETLKGQPPRITLTGIDKELIGHIAAKIRSLRGPEPYKGKGIRYTGEIVRKKAGKSASK